MLPSLFERPAYSKFRALLRMFCFSLVLAWGCALTLAIASVPPVAAQSDDEALARQQSASLSSLAREFLTFRQKIAAAANFRLEEPEHVRYLLSYLHIEDERRLIQSWFAHYALAVADTPAFVVGVRSLLQRHERAYILHLLETERRFARFRIPGVGAALHRIQTEKWRDRAHMQHVARFLLKAAEDWQRFEPREGRATAPPDSLQTAFVLLRRLAAHVEDHAGGGGVVAAAHARGAYTPEDLILTLAARHILGASPGDVSKIDHPDAARCLRWARLDLEQCMVSSHSASEEAWCAGVHGIEEVSNCWRFLLPDE